jgi:hypothetical protein
MKTPQQIIEEMRLKDDGKQERTSTASLLKAIIKDSKEFFVDLFSKTSNEVT